MADEPEPLPEAWRRARESDWLPARPDSPAGALAQPREVQALSRSYRRLADVQERLLLELAEQAEDRRRRGRWIAAGAALAVLLLGSSMGVLAWALRNPPEAAPPVIEVQAAEPPEIVVEPPPVQFELPAGWVDPSAFRAVQDELAWLREEREADRRTIASLNAKLLEREEAAIASLRALGAAEGAEAPESEEAATEQAAPPEEDGDGALAAALDALRPRDPWLGVTNGLLAMDGHGHLQIQDGERVDGEPLIRAVSLTEWGEDGLLQSLVRAGEVRFELHQMSATLVLRLRDGQVTRNGTRQPLPPDGLRYDLPGVNVGAWLDHFPELDDRLVLAPAEARRLAEELRETLEELLSRRRPLGYYRIAELGGVESESLRNVQLQRYDSSGRLVRTLEADSLEVILHPTQDVELLLRRGAIHEGGVRRPFYEDRFRIYLPRQPLDEWRQSGVPYRDLP